MKHYLLAALLVATTPALAQTVPPVGTEAAQPFKKANTVIIHATDSMSVAYTGIAKAILAAGYTIDRSDKELGFVNTKPRPLGRMSVQESLQASLKRSSTGIDIQITGSYSAPAIAAVSPLSAGETRVDYRGMKGSVVMACWEELQRVAALYPNAILGYKQQP